MQTDVDFVNWSPNTNVSSVGVFSDLPLRKGSGQPVVRIWYLIWHCGYDWHHPLQIRWQLDPDGCADTIAKTLRTATADVTVCSGGNRIFNVDLSGRTKAPMFGPVRVGFAADPVRQDAERRINFEPDIQPTLLDLYPFSAVRVAMTGGDPGPNARRITFTAFQPQVAFSRMALPETL